MYEAGYAQGIGLEVLFTCEESLFKKYDDENDLPFDIRQYNIFTWNKGNPNDLAERIIDFIESKL